MEKNQLAPHVEDISRVLGDKVSVEEIEQKLNSYLDTYRVPLGTAKHMLVKKYGGSPADLGIAVTKTITELLPNDQSVDMICRFVYVEHKEVNVKGEPKAIVSGIIGDPTGTVPFTAWETQGWAFEKGDVVKVQGAYTKEWQGQIQVNFGTRTSIDKAPEGALPPYTPGAGSGAGQELTLNLLKEGVRGLTTTMRILELEERKVAVQGVDKTVFSGIAADSTGKVQFTAWSDLGLEVDAVVKVQGAYVKSWRGIPQLTMDDSMQIELLEKSVLPSMSELNTSTLWDIASLAKMGGACDPLVQGILIDIRAGSGLIFRCPECHRVLQKGVCRLHGEVSGEPDLRIKAVVDDGTGAITAVLGREITEKLLGKDLDACLAEAKESFGQDVIADQLVDQLIAKSVQTHGDVTSDDFGLMMVARDLDFVQIDVQAEARKMLEEMEVVT